jgi:hypothetical protein
MTGCAKRIRALPLPPSPRERVTVGCRCRFTIDRPLQPRILHRA